MAGVQAANSEASRLGFGHLRIGTNITPLFGPSAGFYIDDCACAGEATIERHARLRVITPPFNRIDSPPPMY
jgi:hypothetical protein